jgi:hypothetical protein
MAPARHQGHRRDHGERAQEKAHAGLLQVMPILQILCSLARRLFSELIGA